MPAYKSYRHDGIPYDLKLGMNVPTCPTNLKQSVIDLHHDFDFVILNLFHSNNFRTEETIQTRQIAHTRSDTCLPSGYWQQFVIAKVCCDQSNINCDSPF